MMYNIFSFLSSSVSISNHLQKQQQFNQQLNLQSDEYERKILQIDLEKKCREKKQQKIKNIYLNTCQLIAPLSNHQQNIYQSKDLIHALSVRDILKGQFNDLKQLQEKIYSLMNFVKSFKATIFQANCFSNHIEVNQLMIEKKHQKCEEISLHLLDIQKKETKKIKLINQNLLYKQKKFKRLELQFNFHKKNYFLFNKLIVYFYKNYSKDIFFIDIFQNCLLKTNESMSIFFYRFNKVVYFYKDKILLVFITIFKKIKECKFKIF